MASEVEREQGRLSVPERRGVSGSRTIETAWLRLRLPSGQAEPKPALALLGGGPGLPALRAPEDPRWLERWRPVLEVADLVLVEQRGTGRSRPVLRVKLDRLPPADALGDEGAALTYALDAHRRAREALLAAGTDTTGYTTLECVADLDDLRRRLDYERWSVLGFSYGAQWALSYAREHGDAIDRLVLAGVEGTPHTWKLPSSADDHFRRLFAMASEDPSIGGTGEGWVERLAGQLRRLERDRVRVPVSHRTSGESGTLEIGRYGLAFMLARHVSDIDDIRVLPRLIRELEDGETAVLSRFVRRRLGELLAVNPVLALIDGGAAASAERLATIRDQAPRSLLGHAVNHPFPAINDVWQPRDLGDAHRASVAGPWPTLFLSGSLDWNCPPHQAEEVRRGFPDSSHLVVEHAGHETILAHPEAVAAVAGFLRGEPAGAVPPAYPTPRFAPLDGIDPTLL